MYIGQQFKQTYAITITAPDNFLSHTVVLKPEIKRREIIGELKQGRQKIVVV